MFSLQKTGSKNLDIYSVYSYDLVKWYLVVAFMLKSAY